MSTYSVEILSKDFDPSVRDPSTENAIKALAAAEATEDVMNRYYLLPGADSGRISELKLTLLRPFHTTYIVKDQQTASVVAVLMLETSKSKTPAGLAVQEQMLRVKKELYGSNWFFSYSMADARSEAIRYHPSTEQLTAFGNMTGVVTFWLDREQDVSEIATLLQGALSPGVDLRIGTDRRQVDLLQKLGFQVFSSADTEMTELPIDGTSDTVSVLYMVRKADEQGDISDQMTSLASRTKPA